MGNCQHPWLERAPTVCVEKKKKEANFGRDQSTAWQYFHGTIIFQRTTRTTTTSSLTQIIAGSQGGDDTGLFFFLLLIKSARYVENENLCSRAVF